MSSGTRGGQANADNWGKGGFKTPKLGCKRYFIFRVGHCTSHVKVQLHPQGGGGLLSNFAAPDYCKTLPSNLPEAECSIFTLSVGCRRRHVLLPLILPP